MRIRSLFVAAAAATSLIPMGAQAGTANPDDCSSPIKVWSGKGFVSAAPNGLNCPVQAQEMTTSPLLPGGSILPNFEGAQPVERDPAIDPNFGSYFQYTSTGLTGTSTTVKVWLRNWKAATSTTGTASGWQSDFHELAARDSAQAGNVTFVVIEPVRDPFDQTAQQCKVPGDATSGCWTVHTRVYKTISHWFDGA